MRQFVLFALLASALTLVVACGGGGGGGGSSSGGGGGIIPPTPSSSPASAPTPVATATAAMSGGNGSTVGLILAPAATNGVSGITVALPPTSATGSFAVGGWTTLPPGTAALTAPVGPAPVALAYVTLTPSAPASFATTPSIIVNLGTATVTSGMSYYVAALAPGATAWQEPLLGPATQSGVQLTLPANLNVGAWNVQAGTTYTFAIYAIPTPAFTDDWTTYAHDAQRTGHETLPSGSSPLGTITAQNAPSLALAWSNAPDPACHTTATANAVVVDEASPLVANGLVYYADTCGYIAALNRDTGKVAWWYQAPNIPHGIDGVLGTPVLDGTTLIVPIWGDPGNCVLSTLATCDRAHGGYLLALNATTGALLWQSAPLALGNMRGEPFVLNGQVYEGISGGDTSSGFVNGGLAVFNETTGTQIGSTLYFAPPNSTYGTYDGGSSWSPITYDGSRLLLGTGNTRNDDGYEDGILALNPQPGAPPTVDTGYVIDTFDSVSADEDVGGGILLLGGNLYFTAKNGDFYAFSETNAATPLVQTMINTNPRPAGNGGIGTPTTDGTIITASSGYNVCNAGNACLASNLDCFTPGSSTPLGMLQATNSTIFSYAAYGSGVGFIGIDNGATAGVPTGAANPAPEFVAFNDSCKIIWTANPVNVMAYFYGGPAVVASGVYAIDNAGNVYAWKLPYQMGTTAALPLRERLHQTPRTLITSTHYLRSTGHL